MPRLHRLLGLLALVLTPVVHIAPAMAASPLVERGAYLVRGIAACGNCHTPKGPDGRALPDQEMAGGFVIETPVFRAVMPNITPDKETGIGNWTDAQVAVAIREGKRPDGSILGPPMPVDMYRAMSDTDVQAIVAYLRSLRPIRNAVEKSSYKIPLPASYGPPLGKVPDVSPSNKVAYGKYLADIGHCLECHTPMVRGQLDVSKLGGGGRELPGPAGGVLIAANLTPGNPDGIAKWTNTQVKHAIAAGVRPDGRQLVRLMAFDWYKSVTDKDLDALVAYLRTLKPVKP